jgi:hypothetical protein
MMNDESARAKFAATFAFIGESQRDSGIQPRVATQALPWANEIKLSSTPMGLWQFPRGAGEDGVATTALRLGIPCE